MEIATSKDEFIKTNISGFIGMCQPVFRYNNSDAEGILFKPKYILLEAKRSKSNYVNKIGDIESKFCLDNRSNQVNSGFAFSWRNIISN